MSHSESLPIAGSSSWSYTNFDGHDSQKFFASHPLLPAAVVAAYLGMVSQGPKYMATRRPFELRAVSRCWNIGVAIFSICGATVCVPHLCRALYQNGLWYSVCADIYELAGYGPPAFWATLFTWSKLFELFDTALLVLKKRPVITLHWFHHASVIGFAWAAWAFETPAALWYGAMNYSVHAVMYTYFALTATKSFRAAALRVAPCITALQISQFAWGTVINIFAGVAYSSPSIGCAIKPPILWIAAALYLVYGCLFVQLFVQRYLRKPAKGGGGGVDASDRLTNGHEKNGNGHSNGSNGHSNGYHEANGNAGLKAV